MYVVTRNFTRVKNIFFLTCDVYITYRCGLYELRSEYHELGSSKRTNWIATTKTLDFKKFIQYNYYLGLRISVKCQMSFSFIRQLTIHCQSIDNLTIHSQYIDQVNLFIGLYTHRFKTQENNISIRIF